MGIMPDKQLEERDANPTADTPGRVRGRRAPTTLTAGGTESSEVVARLSGTESSNPLPSSGESTANPVGLAQVEWPVRRRRSMVLAASGAMSRLKSAAVDFPIGRLRTER